MSPPVFDAAAKARAKAIAAAFGRPKARDAGLLALHAVVHAKTADAALQHFGVCRQRFSEWKQLILCDEGIEGTHSDRVNAAPFDQALLVSKPWLAKHVPGLYDFQVGAVEIAQDGLHATRRVQARIAIDDAGELNDAIIIYECSPSGRESAAAAADRRKRNRLREEHALRCLDVISQAEHQLTKRQRRKQLRKDQQPQRQALVQERRQLAIGAIGGFKDVMEQVWEGELDRLPMRELEISVCVVHLIDTVIKMNDHA